MSLLDHARRELEIAGFHDEDVDYGAGEIAANIMKIIDIFVQQGHSGGSAGMMIPILTKLMSYEPLTPLTGEDSEWMVVAENLTNGNRGTLYQNIRASHVFKDDDGAYDIQGKVFREPNGACYTSYESRVPVEFPYIPKIEYVDVPDRGKQ